MTFIHPLAYVSGNVSLGSGVFILPFAVVRGDTELIQIGEGSNVQDGAVLHADIGMPCIVGKRVTIGHRAIVHGATVGDDALIGMGAIVLNRAQIGAGALVAAGALVPEGMIVPPNSLAVGSPAKVVREVDESMRERMRHGAEIYVQLRERHRTGEFPILQ
jgi:carbonic anhydrase/acetyltransferase-like protein (isoleucine patch superfamily)